MTYGNQDEPVKAVFVDKSGRVPNQYRLLKPMLIPKAEIDAEIARLAEGEFKGSRRSVIVNPALLGSGSLYPAVSVSVNVLLPGERTRPHRHNSSVVNFGIQGSGRSIVGGREIEWGQYDTFNTPPSSNGTSPLTSQSNSDPGWSFLSAMKPSTDTEAYMTTLPTGPLLLGCLCVYRGRRIIPVSVWP